MNVMNESPWLMHSIFGRFLTLQIEFVTMLAKLWTRARLAV